MDYEITERIDLNMGLGMEVFTVSIVTGTFRNSHETLVSINLSLSMRKF